MTKLLSYIIPLYNSAKWLPKCLDSVLNQDIPEEQVEIICVNDGSPDISADIARVYQREHPCVIVIDQENQGPSGARNNGMRHATGKYLAFVDPDDYVEPHVFGKLVCQMEEEQLDMLRFNYQIVNENYNLVEKRDYEKAFDYTPQRMSGVEFLADRLDIACNIWRYIYRTDIILKNNIWCYTGDFFDDTPWLPLVLMKAKSINITDTIVYNYLERSDSLVKADSPQMIQRKTDGSFLLFKLLEDQLRRIDTLLPENTDIETRAKVIAWYKNIEAHMVVSLLTMTAVHNIRQCPSQIHLIRDMGLLPLSPTKCSTKNLRKVKLCNKSPYLLVSLIFLKNLFVVKFVKDFNLLTLCLVI